MQTFLYILHIHVVCHIANFAKGFPSCVCAADVFCDDDLAPFKRSWDLMAVVVLASVGRGALRERRSLHCTCQHEDSDERETADVLLLPEKAAKSLRMIT